MITLSMIWNRLKRMIYERSIINDLCKNIDVNLIIEMDFDFLVEKKN